jgi:hypothetical protein
LTLVKFLKGDSPPQNTPTLDKEYDDIARDMDGTALINVLNIVRF